MNQDTTVTEGIDLGLTETDQTLVACRSCGWSAAAPRKPHGSFGSTPNRDEIDRITEEHFRAIHGPSGSSEANAR